MWLIKNVGVIHIVILNCVQFTFGVEWTYGLQGSTARSSEDYDLPLLIPPSVENVTLITGPRLVSKPWARHIVSSGSDVTLNCTLDQPYDITVSWTRGDNILSVNNYKYSSDNRLSPVSGESSSSDHSLMFQDLHTTDSGTYLCRVATVPEQVAAVKLVVLVVEHMPGTIRGLGVNRRGQYQHVQHPKYTLVRPYKPKNASPTFSSGKNAYSVIFGASDVSVMEGGKLFLLCLVLQVSDVPNYIMWLRDGKIINYNDHPIDGSIATVSMDIETRSSELAILNVKSVDSGIYTCVPSNAEHAEVNVSVYPKREHQQGKEGICDSCILVLQMGATVAFFCLSFCIAFCVHDYKAKHGSLKEEDDDDDYDPYENNPMMFQ